MDCESAFGLTGNPAVCCYQALGRGNCRKLKVKIKEIMKK
jgi:hypothetical protein